MVLVLLGLALMGMAAWAQLTDTSTANLSAARHGLATAVHVLAEVDGPGVACDDSDGDEKLAAPLSRKCDEGAVTSPAVPGLLRARLWRWSLSVVPNSRIYALCTLLL